MQKIAKLETTKTGNEYTAIRTDGSRFPVIIYSSAIIENEKFIGFRGTIIDITSIKQAAEEIKNLNLELEQRVKDRTSDLEYALSNLKHEIGERQKTEEELRQAKEDLSKALDKERELNELKTRFVSMVSHEYRTPLTVILSSSELLPMFYQQQDLEGFSKSLGRIKVSIKQMVELLENVLTINRTDSGKIIYNPAEMDIVDYCSELIAELKVIDSKEHNIVFSHNIKSRIINSDRKLLHLTLSNVLSNAIKYSPENKDIIFELNENNNELVFKIKDNGIGISNEEQKYLFDPFYRGVNTGKIAGTGLGLAIVKQSAELLKGNIAVSSEPGKGSTFTISIPLNKVRKN